VRVLFIVDQIDYEPQGLMCLSSVLKADGHAVRLVVGAREDPVEAARRFQPGIVGYSVITGSQRWYLETNRRIKAALPQVFAAFGGPHATFFPEMIEEEGVDGVCQGEGEGALLDLARALDAGGLDTSIANWSFKVEGQIIRNPVRPYIANLDDYPAPDRELVYEQNGSIRANKIKYFLAGRGCPYACTYCFNHAMAGLYHGKGRAVRMRSVDAVLREAADVRHRYGLEFAVFLDDTFILDRRWLAEFAERYRREIGAPFFCNVRANLVNEEIVGLLKQAGCHSVSMGLETGNPRIRNEMLKRGISEVEILNAAKLLHAGGIQFTTTNMIGLPATTPENDMETLALNIACKPAYAHAFIFQPYPRTSLGEFARDNALMVGSFDDIGEVAWDDSVLKFSPEHKRRLRNLQRFFAIMVEWPRLRPFIEKFLLPLPSNRLFWLFHKLWKGYAIKNRVHPIHLSLKEYFEIAWHFMRIKS
jgi:radical SAM superfamily enzyme YgiQ (UPF0313 family)